MVQKVKILLLSLSSLLILGAPLAFSGVASADLNQANINNSLCGGSNVNFTGSSTCGDANNSVNTASSLTATIINILSLLVGAVAVVMLIIGGFRYVASGGKQESVASAKNTIVYALVGLVIVALAQLVVHFVLAKVTNAASAS
jgi:hypothetical protein